MPHVKQPRLSRRHCWMLVLCLTPLLAASSDVPPNTLTGQVVDASGAPAAGMDVILTGLSTSDGVPTLARGMTDEGGRFTLQRPPDLEGDGAWRPVRLWAFRPSGRFAYVAFPGLLPAGDEPVRLEVPAPAETEFLVVGPDGEPAAGVKVRVVGITQLSSTPKELAPRLTATTDADGRAKIDAVSGEQVYRVEVEADGLGIQPRYFEPPLPGLKRVVLRPAGAVEGRFVTEGGRSPGKWTVSATTNAAMPEGRSGPAGRADSIPLAEDGSFRFPALASGSLDFWVRWEGPDPDLLPEWPKSKSVVAGQVNRVEIPMRPATPITGVVRERGTETPIPGVRLYLTRPGESSSAGMTTDAKGRFRFTSLPGKAQIRVGQVPPTHFKPPPQFSNDGFEVPAPPGHVELPPIELSRAAPPLQGIVRDEAGTPVIGATIDGRWSLTKNGHLLGSGVGATSGGGGRFILAGVAPDAHVSLTARKGSMDTTAPVVARVGQDEQVVVTLKQGRPVSVATRVVSSDGTPLEGAAVRFNARNLRKGTGSIENWRIGIMFDGLTWLYTRPDGTVQTPEEAKSEGLEYQAEAVASGYLKLQGPWTPAGEADVVRLPDLVLRPEPVERLTTGRVVDSAGKPIAGARVLQRGDGPRPTETKTDADGRFRLPGVAGARALIAAEAPGFRFGGAIAGAEGPVEIRLARVDEAVKPLGRAPEPLTRAEERALGLALLEPKLEAARGVRQIVGIQSPDAVLARLAPDRVMAMLEDRVVQNPSAALIQIALSRFEDDPAAAVATLDADRSELTRAYGLMALAGLASSIAPERRADLLDRATAEGRRIESDVSKLLLFGEIADRWLESMDLDRAAPILREGHEILKKADPPIFAHQIAPFGEALSTVDRPAAEAFLAKRAPGSSDDEGVRMRQLGAMAIRLAVADPGGGGTLGGRVARRYQLSETHADLLRIARNMARADLPRARKVLDLFDTTEFRNAYEAKTLKQYGLALLAEEGPRPDPGRRPLAARRGIRRPAWSGRVEPSPPELAAGRLDHGRIAAVGGAAPARPRLRAPLAGRLLSSRSARAVGSESGRTVAGPGLARLSLRSGDGGRDLCTGGDAAPRACGAGERRRPVQLRRRARRPADHRRLRRRALASLLKRLPASARVPIEENSDWVRPGMETQAHLFGAEMLGMPPEARRHAAIASPFGVWPVEGNGRYNRQ